LPEIAARILRENELPEAAVAAIRRLIADMPYAPIRPVEAPAAPDAAEWQRYISPYVGWNWLDPPWFFVESYFYRRVLEATGYFHTGPFRGYDPFRYPKEQGLTAGQQKIATLAARLEDWNAAGWRADLFAGLLMVALWGNQGDLSLWPADAVGRPDHSDPLQAATHILSDDTATVTDYLAERTGCRVDLITDNAGYEFITDLCLVDYLLASGVARHVVLNVKAHPYFVSDVTRPDVEISINWLVKNERPAVRAFGRRVDAYKSSGRLSVQTDPFWTSPLPFWEVPASLREELSSSSLLIFKGDANYRRLLGDRHWPFSTPFSTIVADPPAPVLALRTLKAELAAGLQPQQLIRLDREEPDWMVNGRWGVIQFANIA
jgi:hypothetical protein